MLSEGRILSERDVLAALARGQRAATPTPVEIADGDPRSNGAPRELPVASEPDRVPLDRDRVEQALQQVGGNRSAAARLLGVSRRALYRRLDTFGLR